MDDFILSHARQNAALEAQRQAMVSREGSALLCVEFYGDHADELVSRIDGLERDLRGSSFAHRVPARAEAGRSGTRLVVPRGLAWALDGDDRRRQGRQLRRRHRGRARTSCATTSTGSCSSSSGTTRSPASTRTRRSAACTFGRSWTSRPPTAWRSSSRSPTRWPISCSSSAARCRASTATGWFAAPSTRRCSARSSIRRFAPSRRRSIPTGLFNPGRIVEYAADHVAPPLWRRLSDPRPGDQSSTSPDHGGFGRAVEMCSGVGQCRKKQDGTMCPSFMVTQEEAHSTRGRANVLRLAMSGRLGDADLSDQAVHEVLDLCLECRACKSECPVGVDVARFKSEFLSGYWERHGTPLRARALGNVAQLARWGSRLRSARERDGVERDRTATERALVRDRPQTRPPQWSRPTLSARLKRRTTPSTTSRQVDRHRRRPCCLPTPSPSTPIPRSARPHSSCSITPGSARALVHARLLWAPAHLARAAGRSARTGACATRSRFILSPSVARPSSFWSRAACRRFARTRRRSCRVKRRERHARSRRTAVLFEEFLERELSAARATLSLGRGPSTILLHPHCHQRSMGLAAPAAALLSRIPGATVTDLDAGCCGMAGSFGYAVEHYDVSRAIGERKLLPAARNARRGWRAGCGGYLVPPPGRAFHGCSRRASRGAAAIRFVRET